MIERLQKILAQAGVASRRASELLIQQGRVTVNGEVVTQLGVKVDPQRETIAVDGEPLTKREKLVYIMLNKPREVLSAAKDERGRPTVVDLVGAEARVYPVGRLDWQSEGLVLLTNDGDLAEKITHPRSHLEKEYHVLVAGHPSRKVLERWQRGEVELEGQPLEKAIVERLIPERDNTWLRIILTEGRKRQIREVALKLGHPVKKLQRVRIGSLHLSRLKLGDWRYLTVAEVQKLKEEVERE